MSLPRKFFARSRRERLVFLEALAALAWAKVLVHAIPFRWLAPGLGRAQQETPPTLGPRERAVAVEVSWAVQAAARHVRLGFVCLPQAMAAQRLLRRRGVASTLYLGVAPHRDKLELITAHAWLRAGDKIVTGEAEAASHKPLASFAAVVF